MIRFISHPFLFAIGSAEASELIQWAIADDITASDWLLAGHREQLLV
jgi:hypothetical protein